MNAASIALLFPGQGSQAPGMGRALAEEYPAAREIFARADAALGRSISKLCFEGSEEDLRQTANTQPALYVASSAALAALRAEGIEAGAAAGHSLGEYSALHAAGALDFETGLRLVDARARAMQKAGESRPGAMAAILGLAGEKVAEACAEAAMGGVAVAANWNSPDQLVISGEEAAVAKAMEIAKAKGAKRAIKLNVGGAFHSPLMAAAAEELGQALAGATIARPRILFIANVTGEPTADPEAIRSLLARQLASCVLWSASVRKLADAGFRQMIEVGPGKVLSGLTRRIAPEAAAFNFSNRSELEGLKASLSASSSTG